VELLSCFDRYDCNEF